MKTVFTDGVIRIRPYAAGDAEALIEAARESAAEAHPFMPWCHAEYGSEDAREWLEAREDLWALDQDYSFVIENPGDGRFLGGVGLNQLDRLHHRANLGYWVRTSAARRGLATRASLLCARFGFDQLTLVRLEILCSVENAASQRVAEKIGATREGVLRARLSLHGRMHDAVLYSLLPADFAAA